MILPTVRAINRLLMAIKVPPGIAQFNHTLDKNTATQLFKLFNKYRPETKLEKKVRLAKAAEAVNDGKAPSKDVSRPSDQTVDFF